MMATTFQMYFAYRAVVRHRWLDGIGLAVATLINVYSHYMGLAATAAAAVFVGVALVVKAIASVRDRSPGRNAAASAFASALPALLAAVLIVIGYFPWSGTLRAFLHRPTVGYDRYTGQRHQLKLADVQAMLGAFDFTGLALVLLGIGVVACVCWALRRQLEAPVLLGAWIIVPLAGLVYKLHGNIALLHPRYLSFLLPAGILLVTAGIEGLASLIARLPGRVGQSWTPVAAVAAVVLTLASGAQLLAVDVAALAIPKPDYRGAANLIVGSSPSDSVVLAVGPFSNHLMIGLGYYLQAHHSSIALIGGAFLDDRSLARIQQSRGTIWGAIDLERASTAGFELHRFPGITLIRWPSSSGSTTERAKSLLRWATSFEPRDRASLEFLDAAETIPRGPSLLPAAAEPVVLRTHGGDATLPTTIPVIGGEDLLARFSYRNAGLSGQQVILISAADASGNIIQEFPTGQSFPQVNGYQCLGVTAWMTGAFAFQVPPGTTSVTVWLRAHGTGVAEFREVELLRL